MAANTGAVRDFIVDILGFRERERVVSDDNGSVLASWLSVTNLSHDIAIVPEPTDMRGRLHHVCFHYISAQHLFDVAELAKDGKIFSGAYIHNDLQNYAHVSRKKHPRYIRFLKEMMQDDLTGKLQAAQTYRDAFRALCAYPLHENFIGMQHLTDVNFSTVIRARIAKV